MKTKLTVLAAALATLSFSASASEQSLSSAQNKAGADATYSLGARGKGVVVAVLDSGLDVKSWSKTELKNRIISPYDATVKSTTVLMTDTLGHGTSVAGVIAAARDNYGVYGVAPEAYIMPIRIFSTGSTNDALVSAGMSHAISNKAFVANLSWGSPYTNSTSATPIKNAVNAGMLIVAAAGNSSLANPDYPARYANQSWANGQIIAVGAVDEYNRIAYYSNRAGDAKNWYLVAQGNNVATIYKNGSYVYQSGTSMAAPIVSGAAATVKSYWNYLTAPQVAQVLFKSATHLGASPIGTPDAVYGWGAVNLVAALKPIGAVKTVTGTNGVVKPVAASTLANLSAIAGKTRLSSLNVVVIDDLGRGFNYNLADSAKESVASSTTDMLTSFNNTPMYEKVSTSGKLAYSSSSSAFAMSGTTYTMGFGQGGYDTHYFGLSSTKFGFGSSSRAFNAPYMGLVKSGNHMGYGFNMAGSTVKMGMVASPKNTLNNKVSGLVEIETPLSNGMLVTSLGVLSESKGFLGVETSGLYETPKSTTHYVSLAGGFNVATDTVLAGMVSMGVTKNLNNTSDNFLSTSDIVTSSWSLGIAKSNVWRDSDRLSFTVSSPMTTTNGTLHIASAVEQSQEDGSLSYGVQSVNLNTKAPVHTEFNYSTPLSEVSKLDMAYMVKLNNASSTPVDHVVGIRYTTKF